MESGHSGSGGGSGGGVGSRSSSSGGGISSLPERAVQQMILNPIPGPSTRPYLAQPVQVPPHFLIPPGQLLPHQVKSGIDIGNLFKLLNALQNRIALACGQHQFLRDPLNQPRPPEDGGYKPLTPQAAVRDIRSLCRQQRNLMEKLRRWNCTNDGKCYDLVVSGVYTGICTNCEPFAASRIRMKRVNRALRKQRAKTRRRALKKLTTAPTKSKQQPKKKVEMTVSPAPPLLPPPCQPPRKRRKKSYVNPEPPHPDSILSQENFLSELGLVTPEVYQKTQAESRRTERRRRTTANPKYKSNAFVDPNDVGKCKRSRRSDPSSLELPQPSTLSSPTGAERRRAKQKRYECTVCEKKDVTVQCSRCMSGFHPECIRVTASKAPPPSTISVCPNCVHCNPSIRSSDCILLSRRMSRPSIMGLKSDPEPRSSGNHRHTQSARHQKAASKRRAAAKHYSKSVRRNASSAKSKKPSFKPQTVSSKPRKTAQNSRKSYSKRTLNHSLAVAAAAAVPAYCTSTRSSVEPMSAQEKASSSNQQAQRKRKLDASTSTSTTTMVASKLHKSKQATTLPASDRRGHCTKKEVSSSSTQLSPPKVKETATSLVKKTFPAKSALPLVPSEDKSNISKKYATKPKEIHQDGVVLSQKNSPTTGCIQAFHPGGSKTLALSAQQKMDANGRLKNSKVEKMEENIIPVETDGQVAPSKGTTGKNKKSNNNPAKPGAVDPFCMKRTMIAMSAAAGIVLSNSGIKISNLSNPSPSLAPSTPPTFPEATTLKPAVPEIATPVNSCNQEIDKNVSVATEGKVKTVHKSPKATMVSPLTNLSNKSCEKETKKLATLSSTVATGKPVQKANKAANTVHLPMSTLNNDPCRKELYKSDSLSAETTDKTLPKSIKYSPVVNNAREIKPKTSALNSAELKKKSAQKVPKPAIISQITVLKSKGPEKVVRIEAPSMKETVTNCVQSASNSSATKGHTSDTPIRKVSSTPTQPNGKIIHTPKPAIISNLVALKSKSVEKETKKKEVVTTEPKTPKTVQKSPQQVVVISQSSPQNNKPCEKEAVKKVVTPKAKKVAKPIPKMDPALEQSISDTINRVVMESTLTENKVEEEISDDIDTLPQISNKLNQSTVSSCDFETSTSISENVEKSTKKYSPESWELNLASDDYNFSYSKFSLNANENGFCVSNERERPTSPASNSSTIGSPRSLRDLESDSSDDLLSIPDTPLAPYLELKRLEMPGPFLDLSAIDRLQEYRKNLASSSTSKRGRPSGRGRGGRH